ncbi:MAG: galactose mutarotase [Firmicutes bacterium]|nr:galactose mutarotase [Bacillota bacterium]
MIGIKEFGILQDGRKAFLYTITNAKGNSVSITNYGGRVVNLCIHDKSKKLRDVVLGYDNVQDYENDKHYLGATVGRYANRIAGGQYTIGNQTYQTTTNDGENTLHGGIEGFDKVLWEASVRGQEGNETLTLMHRSVDGDQGFNGTLDIIVEYCFTNDDAFIMDTFATCDQTTVCNLCNHTYFNLDGEGSTLFYHKVRVFANSITEIDEQLCPTGSYLTVNGALDLRKGRQLRTIRSRHPLIKQTGGYDFNYCINNRDGAEFRKAATVKSLNSGIKMDVFTTKPGIQFYTGNSLDGFYGKGHTAYKKHSGFCLETQFYPDSPNKAIFPSALLVKGNRYIHRTIYQFDK